MDTPDPEIDATPRYGAPPPTSPQPTEADAILAPAAPQSAASPPVVVVQQPRGRAGWWVAGCFAAFVLLSLGGCCVFAAALGRAGDGKSVVGDAVALIHIDGTIQDSGAAGLSGGSGVSPEAMIRDLKRAEKDDRVKAVLLRVNSPGGTVSASQEIAIEVARMKKPVIADIGDMGASGAYMIASQCDTIVASPSSAVGSIGVILSVPNLEDLMKKLGVRVAVLKEGKYKDAGSPYREMTPEERRLIQDSMRPMYEEFIQMVAKGRKLPESKVREMATGWVWSGREAKERGLVDVIGTYSDAVRVAGEAGGISGEPTVVSYDTPDFLGTLQRLVGAVEKLGVPGATSAGGLETPVTR
jgi:protease-4